MQGPTEEYIIELHLESADLSIKIANMQIEKIQREDPTLYFYREEETDQKIANLKNNISKLESDKAWVLNEKRKLPFFHMQKLLLCEHKFAGKAAIPSAIIRLIGKYSIN